MKICGILKLISRTTESKSFRIIKSIPIRNHPDQYFENIFKKHSVIFYKKCEKLTQKCTDCLFVILEMDQQNPSLFLQMGVPHCICVTFCATISVPWLLHVLHIGESNLRHTFLGGPVKSFSKFGNYLGKSKVSTRNPIMNAICSIHGTLGLGTTTCRCSVWPFSDFHI